MNKHLHRFFVGASIAFAAIELGKMILGHNGLIHGGIQVLTYLSIASVLHQNRVLTLALEGTSSTADQRPEAPIPGSLHPFVSSLGVTVAELKKHIASWPEIDSMGEPTEVWIETEHQLSSPCIGIETLNCRMCDDGTHVGDLLFCPLNEQTKPSKRL